MAKRLSFDLTDEDFKSGFSLAPEGWHTVTIEEGEEGESSNGNLQYILKYKSTNDSFAGTVRDYVTITQKTIGNVAKLVSSTGATPVPSPADPSIPEIDDLIGKELQINIEHNADRNGKTDENGKVIKYANVKYFGYRPAGAPGTAKAKSAAKKAGGFSL